MACWCMALVILMDRISVHVGVYLVDGDTSSDRMRWEWR